MCCKKVLCHFNVNTLFDISGSQTYRFTDQQNFKIILETNVGLPSLYVEKERYFSNLLYHSFIRVIFQYQRIDICVYGNVLNRIRKNKTF